MTQPNPPKPRLSDMTECTDGVLRFQGQGRRRVEGRFDGENLSSDGGALLLRAALEKSDFFGSLSCCFNDHRNSSLITHSVQSLLEQRIYGLVCGYEDLNDHDSLRHDSVFQLLTNKIPGEESALASHSTLNRLELSGRSVADDERYNKISLNEEALKEFFVNKFVDHARKESMKEVIIDFDATDLPLHGGQEERHFHGYYKHHCYLPLYAFCGDFPLYSKLRPSNIDASLGTDEALEFIVPRLREALPGVRIIVRADSGFCREQIMKYCEDNEIDFVIGIARNERLESFLEPAMAQAQQQFEQTNEPSRVFEDFSYQTLNSWSKPRRVVGKAEYLAKGENPRFVVTSLSETEIEARNLYEVLYCMRGDAENRIKEQLQLFAGRTSCQQMVANQLRLWLSTLSYLALVLFRHTALEGKELAKALPNTIRVRLLKIAVQIRVSARRIYLSFSKSFTLQQLFWDALGACSP